MRVSELVVDASGACARTEVSVGRAFGTFGELLQGALPEAGPEFLVTFPSTCGARPASACAGRTIG